MTRAVPVLPGRASGSSNNTECDRITIASLLTMEEAELDSGHCHGFHTVLVAIPNSKGEFRNAKDRRRSASLRGLRRQLEEADSDESDPLVLQCHSDHDAQCWRYAADLMHA